MLGLGKPALAQRGTTATSRSVKMVALALSVLAPVPAARAQPPATQSPVTRAEAPTTTAPVTLEAALRAALEHNPDLAEAKARSRAIAEEAPARGRLPDPELEYQLWAQPLARPVSLDEAQMHMFGLRQTIPAPGTLSGRSEAAAAKADIAEQSYRARRLDVVAKVRRAYASYYLADREHRLHLEHAELTRQVAELARAMYQAGRGNQQDVLRVELALLRLHNDVTSIQADRATAAGLLNALMGRSVDAPLGPPAGLELDSEAALARKHGTSEQRPELIAARSAVAAEENELSAARAAGRWPSFMVGVQYMYMPMMDDVHNYGLMLSMSVPWLNARYGEETRAAEARVAAERSALRSAQLAADYQLHAAARRLEAARETFARIETELLPQAQRNFEATRANYRGGQLDSLALLDALGALLTVRTERERALANLAGAAAELERADGTFRYDRPTGAGK